uniref:Uncharacterized protein n=1 Tax=Bubo bubo TaxID=30461 RepID=A0A8C0F621_BUBBB
MDVGVLNLIIRAEEAEPVRWGPEREKAFQAMKGALASAPALGFRVLTQKLGPQRRPVASHSAQPDLVAVGNNFCVRAVTATAAAVGRSRR